MLSCHDVPSEVQERLQEVYARQQSLFVAVLEFLKALCEVLEARVVEMLSQPAGHLDLDFFALPLGVWRSEHGFEQVGIDDQRLQVVMNGIGVDVGVYEFDGLGTKAVP